MSWIRNNTADKVGAIETVVSRTAIVPADADFSNLTTLLRLIMEPAYLGLQGLYQNATDFISRLMYIPFIPTPVETNDLELTLYNISDWVPTINTHIGVKLIDLEKQLYTLGEYYVQRLYNNFADLNGYTKIDIYLPYFGFVSVNPNDVMGKYIQIRMGFDVLSGVATYYIGVTDEHIEIENPPIVEGIEDIKTRILSVHTTKLGSEIPLGSTNAGDVARNLLLGAVKVAGTAVAFHTGLKGGAFVTKSHEEFSSVTKGRPDGGRLKITEKMATERSTTRDNSSYAKYRYKSDCFNTAVNALSSMHLEGTSDKPSNMLALADGSRNVYVVIYRPKMVQTGGYGKLYGFPCGKIMNLSEVYGYTEISAIHIEGEGFDNITNYESNQLNTILSEGIILPNA